MRQTILTATLMAFASNAAVHAQEERLSFGVFGGINTSTTGRYSESLQIGSGNNTTGFTLTSEAGAATGWTLGAIVDQVVNEHWHLEYEASYRMIAFDASGRLEAVQNGVIESVASRAAIEVSSLTGYVNAWRYSGEPGASRRFFVGGGVGIARNTLDARAQSAGTLHGLSFNDTTEFGGESTDLAWQAGLGWDFQLTPETRGRLGYRYTGSAALNGFSTETHGMTLSVVF